MKIINILGKLTDHSPDLPSHFWVYAPWNGVGAYTSSMQAMTLPYYTKKEARTSPLVIEIGREKYTRLFTNEHFIDHLTFSKNSKTKNFNQIVKEFMGKVPLTLDDCIY
jgi:hypothetical protein